MVLTGSFVLSPVIGLCCHRHQRFLTDLNASVEASGPHDFAVHVCAVRLSAHPRPPHPVPTSVTIAKRPSEGRDGANCKSDLGRARKEIFLPGGTGQVESD